MKGLLGVVGILYCASLAKLELHLPNYSLYCPQLGLVTREICLRFKRGQAETLTFGRSVQGPRYKLYL